MYNFYSESNSSLSLHIDYYKAAQEEEKQEQEAKDFRSASLVETKVKRGSKSGLDNLVKLFNQTHQVY
jgi:hypothetical protein